MNDTTKLGLLLPAVLNPATAALFGIAAIAVDLCRMLPDDEKDETVDAVLINLPERAIQTVEVRLPTVELAEVQPVNELSGDSQKTADPDLETAPAPTSETDQRELIRKAMSELGKRSAAARAKKKAEPDQVQ